MITCSFDPLSFVCLWDSPDMVNVLVILHKAPKTSRVHVGKSSRSPSGAPQQTPGNQWENIIKFLDSLMSQLRENHVRTQYLAYT